MENTSEKKKSWWEWYKLVSLVIGILGFFGTWFYFIAENGSSGLLIGWLPAAISGLLIGLLWPLWILAVLFGLGMGLIMLIGS